MEARFLAQNISPIITPPSLPVKKIKHSPIHAVVTENITGITIEKPRSDNVSNLTGKTVYNDSWIEELAINHLSQSVQAATGLRNRKNGYDGLVQAAVDASRKFNLIHQRELVLEALANAIPRAVLHLIKTLLPQTKFTREYFAGFTTLFFVWLIGHCEVRQSEFNGRKEKNVVHIKKCRFLEQTNCIGMCTNLCKVPTQMFIKESLGMPVNMVPNFDDMSCEMIFGEDPPVLAEDPAFKQPCYKLCKVNQKHNIKCTT